MQKFFSLLENNFRYLLTALIVIIPLYPKFPFIRIPGIYVSIRFEDFLLLIIAIATVIKIIPMIKELVNDSILRAFLVFFLVAFVSLVSGIFLTQTVIPAIGFLHLARRLEYLIPFLAVAAFFPWDKGKNLEFYIKTLGLVIFIVFIYGVGQRYFNFPVIITQNEEYSKGVALRWIPGSHINSTFAGHYDLASFLVLVLPIFISLLFIFKDKMSRIFLLGVILSGLWLLINSVSRISLISYLLAASVSLFLLKKYKEIAIVIGISLLLSLASPALLGRYARLKDIFSYVIPTAYAQSETVREDRSTSIRLNVEWPRAVRAFTKNSLIGTGYSSIGLATDNDYLRALGEIGILGFLAFILILKRVGGALYQAREKLDGFPDIEKGFIAGIIGGFVGVLLNALFIDIFEASKFAIMFWLLIGIAVYTVKERQNEQNI